MSYPKWKFKGNERRLVETPTDEAALGAGWGDSPGGAVDAKPTTTQVAEEDLRSTMVPTPPAKKNDAPPPRK